MDNTAQMSQRKWTADDIPDQTGKTIIVTGANSGTGFQATRVLAQKGAHVIMACRNAEKANHALNTIKSEIPDASIEFMQLDLGSLASVRKFADQFKAKHSSLDILINNAGLMMTPQLETEDGFELQLGVNHLGHFALTGLLFDCLKKGNDARVVNMSSGGHTSGEFDFNDIHLRNNYDRSRAYGNSKLANLLFTYELQRKVDAANLPIKSIAAHPGWTKTNGSVAIDLGGNPLTRGIWRAFLWFGNNVIAMKPEQGALGLLRAAVDPTLKGGEYVGPKRLRGYPKVIKSHEKSYDKETAQRLWEISEELTGVTFDFS